MTTRSYAANLASVVSPPGVPGSAGEPVWTHCAKSGSTSIRATVRQADPQVTGDCCTGPTSPTLSRKVATALSLPSRCETATPAHRSCRLPPQVALVPDGSSNGEGTSLDPEPLVDGERSAVQRRRALRGDLRVAGLGELPEPKMP